MGLLDRFKRKPRSGYSRFSSYKNPRLSVRKPFEPKGEPRIKGVGPLAQLLRSLKILGGLALFTGLIYTLFFTKLFEIQKISVTGSSDTIEEQTTLNTSLQQYLGKNLLTLNTAPLKAELLKQYPYLKTLGVHRSFFHTLSVVLETYENKANVRVDYENGDQQFFTVNEEGYIARTGISDENLPTIVMDVTSTDATLPGLDEGATPEETTPPNETTSPDQSTPTEEATPNPYGLNEQLIPKETLETLLETAKDFVGRFNMQILEIHYLKQARELHLLTERHFSVWLDLTQDLNLQLTKLKKALTVINIYEADLDYIDLRISGQNGEKVIYRLR